MNRMIPRCICRCRLEARKEAGKSIIKWKLKEKPPRNGYREKKLQPPSNSQNRKVKRTVGKLCKTD
ncbi:hypothetical protein PVK06_019898 [Gossypium arboreum]|uniref:Uncharacterized protein n=1 Tax=Gossypium arboreum TaxID=29729 RepID=A0ABR0PKX9_GOSAR|nr:hypothetical protein PVK06_019898 [Gossypium arboreum]